MVIIDNSRVHCLKVQCCHCPNAMSSDIQMFQHGFFPASFNRPKTAFTFRVLDDFLLDNLECGTLVINYYSNLQQMTSSMFPHLVPVMPYLHLKEIILTKHLGRTDTDSS
ncbi:hypothetical protein BDR04DRAFT_1013090 [Suillus decipiens]|nr:hypothetical protein BDR04DRAFT_1013090 [Suillus decipiens]